VEEGIKWVEANTEEEKEVYDAKQKEYENKIRPIMAKLYQSGPVPTATSDSTSNETNPIDEMD
jgi:hypothetical protein